MGQSWSALYWFTELMAEGRIASILELGTGRGALTCLFAMTTPDKVTTVDISDRRNDHIKQLHDRLGVRFVEEDVLKPATATKLTRDLERPTLILCDDGDKPTEFALYAPKLRPGDIIAVHDTPAEFKADDYEATSVAHACGLERCLRRELDRDGTRLAVWRKL